MEVAKPILNKIKAKTAAAKVTKKAIKKWHSHSTLINNTKLNF